MLTILGGSGAGAYSTTRIDGGSLGGAKSEFDVAKLEDGEKDRGGRPTLTQGRTVYVLCCRKSTGVISQHQEED